MPEDQDLIEVVRSRVRELRHGLSEPIGASEDIILQNQLSVKLPTALNSPAHRLHVAVDSGAAEMEYRA
jgi:hypothetical protein